MKANKWINRALTGLDDIGYQLDAMGVTSKVNRHNVIAYVMAEQKHWEGELDSLIARVDNQRFRVERILGRVESLIRGGTDFALKPARTTLSGIKGLLGS